MNKDESDVFWSMYQEQLTQSRHHEAQRTSANTILGAVAGGVIALIGNKDAAMMKWPLAVFLIALGLFGAVFTLKQTERAKLHTALAKEYRLRLNAAINLPEVWTEEKKRSYGLSSFHGLGLWVVWVLFDLFIALLGVLLFFLSPRS